MKKNLLALVAFSGIVFTSCSNEMDQMVEQQKEKNVIGFSTYSMMSKGTPIINNGAFAKDCSSFEVAAFLNDTTNSYLRAQITHNGTSWNYANPLDKAYWPNGADDKLNFFAVAPYSDFYPAVPATGNTVQYSNTADDKSMKITYTVPTITSEQQDLMYAATVPMTKPENGNVTLNFKHALNQIHFMGKTDSKNLKVIIDPTDGIQLFNVYGSAVGTVAQGDQSVIAWDYTNNNANQVFINMTPTKEQAGNIVINTTPESGESVSLTNPSNVLMLLPQPSSLSAWVPVPTTPPTEPAKKTGSYLKISCKLIALGEGGKELAYLYGTADKFADMYVPFNCSAMEASGKKITYTLIFGGGYNNEGQPILTPITFNTEVEGWETPINPAI